MTSFAWGAEAPIFTERDLRRVARHLRLALATLVEDPSRGSGRTQSTVAPDSPPEERNDASEPRGQHGPCGPAHHSMADFADDALREAWREQRRAWRMAMTAAAEAPRHEDPWTRAEESRAKGERGSKGKHRPRRDDAGEGRPERGGPRGSRRPGPETEPGSFGWGATGAFAPFPPFGPFAPGAGRPGRGFRGRGPGWRFEGGRGRAGRGDVRLAILALLSEGPRHGYQLIQDITERSDGAWAPSPGSIYPALSSLQDEGLIDDEKLEGRRVFSLTEAGRAYVAERQEQIDAVFAQNSPTSEHEAWAEIGALMWGVAEAALTVLGTGTESQRAEARDLLARTRRDLFRILAEDTVASPADPRSDSTETGSTDPDTAPASDTTGAPAQADTPEPTMADASAADTGPADAGPADSGSTGTGSGDAGSAGASPGDASAADTTAD